MARPSRIAFPGAFYHVMHRGNTGMMIFRSERDWEKSLKPRPTPDELIAAVFKEFDWESERILQKGKKRNFPRDVAIYLCRQMTGETGVALGRHFGGISGAGITFKYNQVSHRIATDRRLKGQVNRIRERYLIFKMRPSCHSPLVTRLNI